MDKDYVEELERRIRDLDLGATVRLIGPRGDVPTLYAAADVALHASVKVEPFGLVVPEAMVHGTPVIASKFGGPGEVLTEECGRTFDPAAPDELATILTTLARDPALRARLGERARQQVAGFSVDAMVQGVERVYARMFTR
jgi:glycosyltransferase involved in cell wall biosynthesis